MPAPPVELVPKERRERDQVAESIKSIAEELLGDAYTNVTAIVVATRDADGHWHHRHSHNLNLREEIGTLFLLALERGLQVLGEFEDE